MLEELKNLLKEKHSKSGGHCGTYLVELKNGLGIPLPELKKMLNKLHKENKIKVRDGSKGKLIFWKWTE